MESNEPAVKSEQTVEVNFHQFSLFNVTIDPGLQDDDGNELPRPFTKAQMRKWLKKVKWEKNKVQKRQKQKALAKKRIQAARAANVGVGISRKTLKRQGMQKKSMGIIIDLSFDNLMIEKDMCKLIKQILRCYSINRRSTNPLQFHVTSFGERSKKVISRHNGYENWDVLYHEEPYLDIFKKDQLVYLSSESENVIEEFEENTFYIIGGLVDHNQYKGLCHRVAVEQGIRHARLPLDKYVSMKTRKVLTISHVFEIVVKVSERLPWREALMTVLPERKGAQVCDEISMSSQDDMSHQSDITS